MKRMVEMHYYLKDGTRNDFYNAIIRQGIADAARAEDGNEKYAYCFSPENGNKLVLLEIRESAEAVQCHMETPHFQVPAELKKNM